MWWAVRVSTPTLAARRISRRLQRWWVAKSLVFRRIDVLSRAVGREAILLEAVAGGLRLARLTAVPTTQLPAEDWVDRLPRGHQLPIYWVAECVVDARFRHRGLGRRLIARLVEVAFAQQAEALMVGGATSPQARQFASAVGFHVNGEAAYASLGGLAERLLA